MTPDADTLRDDFHAELANGGFSQFFLNSASDQLEATLAALAANGEVEALDLLRRACAVFGPDGPPVDRDARGLALVAGGRPLREALAALDAAYHGVPVPPPAPSHDADALALLVAAGAAEDADQLPEALALAERARTLDPDDLIAALYHLELRARATNGDDAVLHAELDALGRTAGVDVAALRAELAAIGFPTDLLTLIRNGFPHPRNHIASRHRERHEG
ncbi:MAG TPA: DUF4375 domain-containing protein [Gemmatimonadales bacterium]|nr:DUF4375 domain-containing protein [Gemmatimonadales bacterium]